MWTKEGESRRKPSEMQKVGNPKEWLMVWGVISAEGPVAFVILDQNVNKDVYLNLLVQNCGPYLMVLVEEKMEQFFNRTR